MAYRTRHHCSVPGCGYTYSPTGVLKQAPPRAWFANRMLAGSQAHPSYLITSMYLIIQLTFLLHPTANIATLSHLTPPSVFDQQTRLPRDSDTTSRAFRRRLLGPRLNRAVNQPPLTHMRSVENIKTNNTTSIAKHPDRTP